MIDVELSKQSGRRDLPGSELRTHCVSVRLNDQELKRLDDARGRFQRGESLRMVTLNELPKPVPQINEQVVFELSKSLGNLATVAGFLRKHEPEKVQDKQMVEDAIYQVRQLMTQLKKGAIS